MANFFVLYYAPRAEIDKWQKMPKEDADKGMGEWKMWMSKHESDFADRGAPLGKTKHVTKAGVSGTKNEVVGYSIVEAASHEAAANLLKDNPHLSIPGGSFDVMTMAEMPKM